MRPVQRNCDNGLLVLRENSLVPPFGGYLSRHVNKISICDWTFGRV